MGRRGASCCVWFLGFPAGCLRETIEASQFPVSSVQGSLHVQVKHVPKSRVVPSVGDRHPSLLIRSQQKIDDMVVGNLGCRADL